MDLTAEEQRLRDARDRRAVAVLGPVPQRAAVGHGPRGLQRQRRRLVVLLPRPGPLARLPLGRGRAGRVSATSTSGCASRWRCGTSRTRSSRSASSGSPTARATTARTSRSTTSSSTTCRRTPTSAGCTSTRRRRTRTTTSSRRTAPRSRHEMEYELLDTGVFDDDRYFDVEVTYAKAEPDDVVCRITVTQPRPGRRADPPAADAVVPQHVVVPAAHRPRRRCAASTAPARRARRAPRARHVAPPRRRRRRAAVLRQRVQRGAAVGRRRLAAVPEGRHRRPRRARHADRQPGRRRGPRSPPTSASSCPPAGSTETWLRLVAGDRRWPTRSPTPPTSSPPGTPRPTSSTPRSRPDAVDADAAAVMRQALAGMLWSKQSYYFDVDVWLHEHRAHPLRQPGAARHAQRGVVPHAQPRRHLDARHVGVPVVRGVGPRVPLPAAGDGRPRLRHVAARPDAVAGVPPPDRADPGLRVELRRRQPAGPRLRHAVHAQRRRAHGRRRPAVPAPVVHPAAAQLHVVGQPQGPGRQERVRGRLPRARQHRRVRPQRAAADRRPPRAGRRHRRGWRCSARTCSSWRSRSPRTTPTTPTSCSSSSSTSSGSPPRSIRSATTPTRCGTTRTGSSTTCCASPTAPASGSRCARSSVCCRCARRRSSRPRCSSAHPELTAPHRRASSTATATCSPTSPTRSSPACNGRRLLSLVNEDKLRRILARMLDEDRFLGPHGIRSISRVHLDEPYEFVVDGVTLPRASTSRPSRRRACSAATRTGAGRCGSRSTC